MNPAASSAPPVIEHDEGATYTVDILARISGVASETILMYHERGLLRSVGESEATPSFDDDAMRRLRRLESVRETGGMNLQGLCLVSRLLDEVERLRDELRARG